jgi:peptide/nickel transport system permease protein
VSALRRWAGVALLLLPVALWVLSLGAGYDVIADVDVSRASLAPSADHWLGCDHLGRDVLWRLITASESFVGPSLLACTVALLIGVPAGALSGWLGGLPASLTRFVLTTVASLPRFVLVLLVCAAFGTSVQLIALAAGVAYAPTLAEAIYARIQSFRHRGFVLAGRAHGLRSRRILWLHLLWVNHRRLILRHCVQLFAYFLLLETTLSYIGGLDGAGSFGVAQPDPSWGNMIAFEWREPEANLWATWAPGLATALVLLGATWTGRALIEEQS